MTAITMKLSKTNRCRALINSTSRSIYRLDAAKRQTAGVKFTHLPKIWFIAPQGRLVAAIQVKLCMADGHLGVLGCDNIYFQTA